MKSKKYRVYLSYDERLELEGIIKRGKHSSATIKRANILLDLDETMGTLSLLPIISHFGLLRAVIKVYRYP